MMLYHLLLYYGTGLYQTTVPKLLDSNPGPYIVHGSIPEALSNMRFRIYWALEYHTLILFS